MTTGAIARTKVPADENTVDDKLARLQHEVNEIWKTMASMVKEEVAKAVKEQLTEEFEIEKTKKYVIVHNLPESAEALTNIEKEESDTRRVKNIAANILDVEELGISQAFRLGQKNARRNKPRLLKVKLTHEEQKGQLLRGSKKFRSLDTAEHVFRTALQRNIYLSDRKTLVIKKGN